MSEKIIHPEHHSGGHEKANHTEHQERLQKHHESAAEKAKHAQSEVNLAELRESAKAHAEEASPKTVEKHHDREPQTALATQHTLKDDAYKQSLKKVQSQLKGPDKTLSKVVHNKTVDAVSNVGAVTIARPSGLLGGSICAFFGSVILLYTAKHYGFRYNYLVLVMLFIAGFAIGSLIELLIWATYTRKRQY